MTNDVTQSRRRKVKDETPDSLMDGFKGGGLAKMIVFTLVVHVVVLGGTSIPFLLKTVLGDEAEKMTEEEAIQAAVKEATPEIRRIAEHYKLKPSQLSAQLAGGGSRTTKVADSEPPPDEPEEAAPEDTPPDQPEKPKSEMEKELDVTREGPTQPPIDTEEDIFP